MKRDLNVWSVLRPLIFGLFTVGIGIGLVFWFRASKTSSAASFVVAGIVIAGGALMFGSTFLFWYRLNFQNKAVREGTERFADYVSHECKMSTSKSALYNILFTYESNGKVEQYRTPNCYQWDEVLAIRSAKTVKVIEYRNKLLLNESLEKLKINYAAEMERLEKVYEEAYRKVDRMTKDGDPAIAKRRSSSYHKKQEKQKIDEADKPKAKDDD